MIIGSSLWATSYLLGTSSGLVGTRPAWLPHALNLGPVVLGAAGFACLFRFVPHTPVLRWRDAIAGGLLAGIAFEFGKRGFAIYLANVPTAHDLRGLRAPAGFPGVGVLLVVHHAGRGAGQRQPSAWRGAAGTSAVTCMIIDLIDGSYELRPKGEDDSWRHGHQGEVWRAAPIDPGPSQLDGTDFAKGLGRQ